MQHTLIPRIERAALRREYRTRVFIVFCFTLSVAGIIGSVALFPAFIRALQEEKSQLSVIAALQKDKNDSGITEIENDLSRYAEYLSALLPGLDTPKYSQIIEDVVRTRGSVKITSLALEEMSTSSMQIRIQGIAPTRESLVTFKSRLEGLAPGNSVDLPIGELAKSRDIMYSLRVMHSI